MLVRTVLVVLIHGLKERLVYCKYVFPVHIYDYSVFRGITPSFVGAYSKIGRKQEK